MKRNILFMFTGLLIGIVITGAVYAINANEITYKDTTVDSAIDDLYTKVSDPIDEANIVILSSGSYTTTKAYSKAYVIVTRLGTPEFIRNGVTMTPIKTGQNSNYYMNVYKIEDIAANENYTFYGTVQLIFID